MKLDRNENSNGQGKYALILLRHLEDFRSGTFGELAPKIDEALQTLQTAGLIDWGNANTEREFFVIRLKDKYAQNALSAYGTTATLDGEQEYGEEIRQLASRAGPANPWCKKPD